MVDFPPVSSRPAIVLHHSHHIGPLLNHSCCAEYQPESGKEVIHGIESFYLANNNGTEGREKLILSFIF